MFRFSHTTASGENSAVKAVFLTVAETTPTATHFNVKSSKTPDERLSLNQIAFKLAKGASREYGELQKGRAAIAQHRKYQEHVATVGLPQEATA